MKIMKLKGSIWLFWAAILGVLAVTLLSGWGVYRYHEMPQFCGNTCHIMQPYVDTWEGNVLLASKHAKMGVTCLQCHEPTVEEQVNELVKYVQKDYEQPLAKRQFEKEWCLRCHEHGSYAEIAERTKPLEDEWGRNPHHSHNGELECYSCHSIHQQSTMYCAECHTFDWKSKLDESWKKE